VKLFLPVPAGFGLLVCAVVTSGSSRGDAAMFAGCVILALVVLSLWLAATAPAAAVFAARSIVAGVLYGWIGLFIASSAFAGVWTLALDDCSFHRCFIPVLGWTMFYGCLIFLVCGVLFSGLSQRMLRP